MSLRSRWIASVVLLSLSLGSGVQVSKAEPMRISAGTDARVTKVAPDQSGNFVLLNVEGKQPLPVPTPSYFPGPDGQTIMAVDFTGVTFAAGSKVFEPANPDFSLVRFGQFQADPPVFRISITTSNPALLRKIEFRTGQGKLLVLFPVDNHATARAVIPSVVPHAVQTHQHRSHRPHNQHFAEPAGSAHVGQDPRSGQFFPVTSPSVSSRPSIVRQQPAQAAVPKVAYESGSPKTPLVDRSAAPVPQQRLIKDQSVKQNRTEGAKADTRPVPVKVWSPSNSTVPAGDQQRVAFPSTQALPSPGAQRPSPSSPYAVQTGRLPEHVQLERISAEPPVLRARKGKTAPPSGDDEPKSESPEPAPDFVRTAKLPPMPPILIADKPVDDRAADPGKIAEKRSKAKSRNSVIATNCDVSLSLNDRKTADQISLSGSSGSAVSSKLPPLAPDWKSNVSAAVRNNADAPAKTLPETAKKTTASEVRSSENKVPQPAPDRLSWSEAIDEPVSAGPIQVTCTPNGARITLRVGEHKSFQLEDPSRYVIDLATGLPETMELPTIPENPHFSAIRLGTPDETGKMTRVVVDLCGSSAVREEQSGDCLTLIFGSEASPGTFRVVLDAGHGGSDPGAQRGDIQEKDLTMAITEKLRKTLESRGIAVTMTRQDDSYVSLEDRVRLTNELKPDAFVSVHINSLESNSAITGIETYYQNEPSKRLAQSVHSSLVEKLAVPDRNVRKAKFYVVNHTPHPAILAEVGFISNKEERDRLISSEYQTKIAESIAQGIMSYLDPAPETRRVSSATASTGNEAPAFSSAKPVSLVEDGAKKRPK